MKKRYGFTLIEVMVVMAIIAVLTTAGITSYGWYFRKSTQLKADIVLAEKNRATLEFASDHNGRFPFLPSNPNETPNDIAEFSNYLALHSVSPSHPIATLLDFLGIPKAFAQSTGLFAHPAGVKNICARQDTLNGPITFDAPCEIVYVRSGAGTPGQKAWFFWAAGAVTTDAVQTGDFHSITMPVSDLNYSSRPTAYGIIKGSLPAIDNLLINDTTIASYNSANPNAKLIAQVKASGLTAIAGGQDPSSATVPPTTIPPTTPPLPTIPPVTTPPLPPTIPNTTIPITTPPVSEDPYPTESSTSDYYYPTSSWEESTTTLWEESTTGYESSTSEEQPTMPPFTTEEQPTTEVPSTTGGSYCFFLDLFCPESQYCDDNTCRPNSEAELALSTDIPTTSNNGGDLYCTWTIFAPFTPGNCMSYSTGLPTGEQCWIFDFTCSIPYGIEESSTTEYPTGEESTSGGYCDMYNGNQYDCENNGCYWDYNSYYLCFSDAPTTYGEESSTTWY